MGFFKFSKFGSMIHFQSLNCHWSVLLDQIPLQLDQEGIKEREDGERGGGGGHYSREPIILNISIKKGWLFEGGDKSRDGYYLRKYGTFSDKKMRVAKGLDLRAEPPCITLCWVPPGKTHTIALHYSRLKNYPDETSGWSQKKCIVKETNSWGPHFIYLYL